MKHWRKRDQQANTAKREKQKKKKWCFQGSSVQSLDWLDHRGDMRDNWAEILFQSFLQATTTNCDVLPRHVCAFVSFEGFVWNKPVFRFVVMCFVLSSRVSLFFWLAKILLKSRLGTKGGPKHGGQWRHLATTPTKGWVGLYSQIYDNMATVLNRKNNKTMEVCF